MSRRQQQQPNLVIHGGSWINTAENCWAAARLAIHPADRILSLGFRLVTQAKETGRVVRGGSWINTAECCRTADRIAARPTVRGRDLGFRLASR